MLSASSSSFRRRRQLEKWGIGAKMVNLSRNLNLTIFMKDWWWWEFDKIWKKSSLNIIQKILILTVEISTIFSLTRHTDNLTKVKILKSWFYVLRKKASIGATVVLTQKVSKSFIWEVKLLYLNIFVNLTLMYIVCFFTQKERVLKFEIWTELNILC